MMKFLILIFPIFFLQACKVKEPIPNRPPGDFKVSVTLEKDGKTVTLNWDKVIDPDRDLVTYTVVFGSDTLAKGLTDTVYVLKNLDFEFKGTGSIIAFDTKKLSSYSSFSFETKENPFFSIPDANFEIYLVNLKIDKDGIVNGKMAKADTKGVLILNCSRQSIKSLIGIEYFLDLEELNCAVNVLTNLDLSKNVKLKSVFCWRNRLLILDVKNNVNLTVLDFSNNELSNLDLSKNIKLKSLYCNSNILSSLDVSKNIALELLACSSNQLVNLEVSKNFDLKTLYCSFNQFTSLNLSDNAKLSYLDCTNNNIVTICVSDVKEADLNTNWQKDVTAEYKLCN